MKFANCTTPDHHRNTETPKHLQPKSLQHSAVSVSVAQVHSPHYECKTLSSLLEMSRCWAVGMLGSWVAGGGVVLQGSCPWVKALLCGPSYGVCQSRWAGKKNLSSSRIVRWSKISAAAEPLKDNENRHDDDNICTPNIPIPISSPSPIPIQVPDSRLLAKVQQLSARLTSVTASFCCSPLDTELDTIYIPHTYTI